MKEQGAIFSLQKEALPNWGKSKCLHSDLTFFEKKEESASFSIKIVLSGKEEYRVNDCGFKLEEHQYLIVNKGDALETTIKHKPSAKGVCIYPPENLITEVLSQSNLSLGNKLEFNKNYTSSIRFTLKPSRISANTLTSAYLSRQIANLLSNQEKTSDWWETFYIDLVELLVKDQLQLEDRLKQIPSTKKHTKEELYRRLSLAKDYIHDHRFEQINIDFLSKASALSKFHFLRNFKAFYGWSPYQLSLQLKLKEAKVLIQNNFSYQQASDIVGYSDAKNLRKALLKKI